jgi:hypothetical protein
MMNRHIRFIFCVTLGLFLTTHRLPAPIQEIPESSTPSPEEQGKPKRPSSKPKTKLTEPEAATKTSANSSSAPALASYGPAKFAGGWMGTIAQPMGTSKISFICNETGTVVTMATGPRPATVSGNTISWRSGMWNGNAWTLNPSNDGKTAQVTLQWALGNATATFYRDQNAQPSTAASPAAVVQPIATPTAAIPGGQQTEIPTAKPVSDKPGFVHDPFDPNSKLLLDVRGKASGTKVKDPSGRLFIVP